MTQELDLCGILMPMCMLRTCVWAHRVSPDAGHFPALTLAIEMA